MRLIQESNKKIIDEGENMYPLVESLENEVCYITFQRPERKNALNQNLTTGLLKSLNQTEERKAKIVVLRGSNGTFSTGGDLQELYESENPVLMIDNAVNILNEVLIKIRAIPSIVISVVEGFAVGAGLSLACACDLVVASEDTTFNMGYRRVGLIPDGGGTVFLPKILGDKIYNALYLLSRDITAQEAKELGLVNFIFKKEEFEKEVKNIVEELLSLPFEAVPYYKMLVNSWMFPEFEVQLEKEKAFVKELVGKKEIRERIGTLLGKKRNHKVTSKERD